jgi:PAS domain S-box-containing protein
MVEMCVGSSFLFSRSGDSIMGRKPVHKGKQQKVGKLNKRTVERRPIERLPGDASEPLFDLIEALPDAVFFKDVRGRHLFVNKACAKLAGLAKEKILGKTDKQLLPPDLAEQCALSDQAVIKLRKPVCFEESMTDTDGKETVLETIKVPFLDRRGDVVGLVGIGRDITDRKQAEEALKESEQKYRLLVETMNDGLSIIDKNACLTYVNDRFCQMIGYDKDELKGRLAMELHDETNQSILKEQLQRRRQGGGQAYEIAFTRKDGQQAPAVISPRPLFDADGTFNGSFAVITDVSKLKQAEHELRKRKNELKAKSNQLQEMNTALKVLVKHREEDKNRLEENILSHVKQLVTPYLERLKSSALNNDQRGLVSILEANLKNIVSPLAASLSSKYRDLTPTEIRVADLVKDGKTNDEIADLLCISKNTVKFHRFNLRTKLGVRNKPVNLRSYLMSLAK